MASPKPEPDPHSELVTVCADCFNKVVGKKKAKALLQSECLEKSIHTSAITVRVRLTANGVLDPEVRHMPKAHFKGEFVLCSKPKCKGDCTYPHSIREKAAWNAEKFGFYLPPAPKPASLSSRTRPSAEVESGGVGDSHLHTQCSTMYNNIHAGLPTLTVLL